MIKVKAARTQNGRWGVVVLSNEWVLCVCGMPCWGLLANGPAWWCHISGHLDGHHCVPCLGSFASTTAQWPLQQAKYKQAFSALIKALFYTKTKWKVIIIPHNTDAHWHSYIFYQSLHFLQSFGEQLKIRFSERKNCASFAMLARNWTLKVHLSCTFCGLLQCIPEEQLCNALKWRCNSVAHFISNCDICAIALHWMYCTLRRSNCFAQKSWTCIALLGGTMHCVTPLCNTIVSHYCVAQYMFNCNTIELQTCNCVGLRRGQAILLH